MMEWDSFFHNELVKIIAVSFLKFTNLLDKNQGKTEDRFVMPQLLVVNKDVVHF